MAEQNEHVHFPRKLLTRLIALYKDLPCLWDRHNPGYKMKHKRHEAITKLTELVQEHDPEATRVHILRKIESLRACVRRENKRVRDSRIKATSPEEIYVPHLWYYDLLSFVCGDNPEDGNDFKIKDTTRMNVDSEEDEEQAHGVEDEETAYEQTAESYPTEYNVSTSMIEVSGNTSTTKQYSAFDDDQNRSGNRHCTEIEDEYDAIGINVAAKLRSLPSNMRILAEKLINDVLFQAQINGLTPSTVISTPDPFK